jgi:thermitase
VKKMPYEYLVKGRVVRLPVCPDRIGIRFREPSTATERRAVIEPKSELSSYQDSYEVPGEKLTIVGVAGAGRPELERIAGAVGALEADPAVERVTPVFDVGERQSVATDRIAVGFKPGVGGDHAEQLIAAHGGEVVWKDGDEYLVRLGPEADPFDVIARLMRWDEVDYAEPDFASIGRHGPMEAPPGWPGSGDPPAPFAADESSEGADVREALANDPLLTFQYAVRLTHAFEAWQLVNPSPNVRIAILDVGVEVSHPDLRQAVVLTFNAITRGTDQRPNPWDAHGTACAGLAAATPNNAVGVRGIAGGCSLMSARIGGSPAPGALVKWDTSVVRAGIDWAWQNGAHVLSNSWVDVAPSNMIINGFDNARLRGRGGRGCVIVAAAGNNSGPVQFPASLSSVLAVSASNEHDQPKTRGSADGETWWGTNFGPAVGVAAPGVHNITTDITGAAGFNTGGALDADYVGDFRGTSAATPIVAAVAALVLSVNPNLREEQVRRLLKQTADKVGSVAYVSGRNDFMGDGRVNALRAVQRAPTFV